MTKWMIGSTLIRFEVKFLKTHNPHKMKKTIKQHDISDCGAACLVSIAAHFHHKLPIAKIRQWAGTDKRGTNLLGLINAAQKMGFSAKGVRAQIDDIGNTPVPSIGHIILKNGLHHFVVIYQVTEGQVKIMDPALGKMKWMTKTEWEKIWTGVLLLVAPENDFVAVNEEVSTFKRFWKLAQPHKSVFIQALIGALLYTVLGLSTSIFIQKITDFVLVGGNYNLLNLLSIIMLSILFIQMFIGVSKSLLILKTGQQIDAHLILGYYQHLLKMPQSFFDRMRVGEILSRIGDAVKIRLFINEFAINFFVNVFIILCSFILMFSYYWKLAVLILLIVPLYALTYWISNILNKKNERKLMVKAAELESQMVESLSQIRTIKQFNLENYTNLKTENKFIDLLKTNYLSGLNGLFSGTVSEFISRLFTILLLWAGSYYALQQVITPGELLSFYALLGYFTGPAQGLIGMNKVIQNALIAADRLFEIADLSPEPSDSKVNLPATLVGDIRFESVNFAYGPRSEVFNQLTLSIPKGQITAIVGESGSGKSTIAGIIQKLYPIQSGQVFIGQYELGYLTSASIRKNIAIVPQELHLFAGSVLENIAIGDPYPNMQNIVDILQQLGLQDFINELPNGLHTQIVENANNISTGQKQRLAIARAIYRDPEVLILDEATSALDSISAKIIQNFLFHFRDTGKTIIQIAHRLTNIINADKILVLSKGKLVEQGRHQNLLIQQGKYYQLWKKQDLSELFIPEAKTA